MSNSPLVNVTVKAHPSNYTTGRGGYKINHITVHHMAGILTALQCGNIFAKAGRNGSAHYGVGSDGKIGLYVNESDRAWSDSNWQSNCTTVSIETSNSSIGGNWSVSDLTFNKLVELVADIAKRNGLGILVPGKNLTWHSMYTSTTCPGDYLRGKMQELANRANAINSGEQFNPSYCDGFLPYPNGYWTKGDQNERIGVLAKWMRAKYPDFTPETALGNYYGDNITGAIKRYQELNGLEADGNTGPITYNSLKSNGFTYPNPVYPEKLTWTPMDEPRAMLTNEGAKLVNVETGEVVKTYSADVRIELDQKTSYNGVLYLRTKYSSSKNINNGFASSDLHEVPTPEPTPEPIPEPTPEPEPEPTPEPTPEPADPTVSILEKIIAFIKHIIELITKKQGE